MLSAFLASLPDCSNVHVGTSLMDAYNLAETHAPRIALVEAGFASLPEFEMVLAMFNALDVRWLSIDASLGPGGNAGRTAGVARGAGVFDIQKSTPPRVVYQSIQSLLNAPRRSARDSAPRQVDSTKSQRLVLIGSSTGGIDALSTILSGYPKHCPPTLIVQHTGQSFGEGLIRLLDSICPACVVAVRDGQEPQQGHIYVAAGRRNHLELAGRARPTMRWGGSTPMSGHLPSVDVLFSSAVQFADKTAAAILTGMGHDGAQGLKKLRDAGARTMAQDRGSSVVYGMPRVAWESGAAQRQVPLSRMRDALLET